MKRQRALIMFGLMMLVFIVLSGFSFLKSRGQVTPDQVSFGPHQADDGKRVFQSYNCMGCHTIVGNGAYFAPDLTKEYHLAGPAWLAAFLPSAGSWPTEAAVRAQLLNADVAADAGVSSIEDYYRKYPGAKARIERRGGQTTYMPNLPFRAGEVERLIAYLKYTSEMNTEGWPPEVKVKGGLEKRIALYHGRTASTTATAVAAPAAGAPQLTPAEQGAETAKSLGCVACHSTDGTKLVGPSWKNLAGSRVSLSDGSVVTADDAYLIESILKPNAKVVAGYAPVMPPYEQMLNKDQVNALVAYIHSLGE